MIKTIEPRVPYEIRKLAGAIDPDHVDPTALRALLRSIALWGTDPEAAERRSVKLAIDDAAGGSNVAIELLGMSRTGFYAAVRRLGLEDALPCAEPAARKRR